MTGIIMTAVMTVSVRVRMRIRMSRAVMSCMLRLLLVEGSVDFGIRRFLGVFAMLAMMGCSGGSGGVSGIVTMPLAVALAVSLTVRGSQQVRGVGVHCLELFALLIAFRADR